MARSWRDKCIENINLKTYREDKTRRRWEDNIKADLYEIG